MTQERPQQPEKLEGRESATQELALLQLPVKATAETQEDAETKNQEDVVTQEPTSSQKDAEADRNGFQEEDVVTQEPKSLELTAEIPIEEEVVGRLVEEEANTLSIPNDQDETSGNKVWTQFSLKFIDLDFDKEKDT